MKSLFINTPFIDFTQPQLGIPSIIGYINGKSTYEVFQVDFNITIYNIIFSKQSIQQVKKQLDNVYEFHLYDLLEEHIETAKSILRDRKLFYDSYAYLFAIDILKLAADLYNKTLAQFDFYFDSNFNLVPMQNIYDNYKSYIGFFNKFMSCDVAKIIDVEIIRTLNEYNPDIVFLSDVYDSQDFFCLYFAMKVKQYNPRIKVVVGGTSITEKLSLLKPGFHKIIQDTYYRNIDYFTLYEGEQVTLDLIAYFHGEKSFQQIYNLAYFCVEKNQFLFHENKFINDLNLTFIPIFDEDLLCKYFVPEIVLPYAPTRGCYWGKCKFCSYGVHDKNIATAPYRSMRFDKVKNDLQHMSIKYNTNLFSFTCDAISPVDLEQYAYTLGGSNILWMTDLRLEKKLNDNKLIKLLYSGGLRYISFGLESYSNKNLKNMNKGLTNFHFGDTIRRLRNCGIAFDLMMFNKFPTEDENDYIETLNFIKSNKEVLTCPYGFGDFTLLTNCYVAKHIEEYPIVVNELNNENELFYPDKISYTWLDEYNKSEATIMLENELFSQIELHDRLFVGGNQSAHSFLYITRKGINSINEFNNFYHYISDRALNIGS